MCAVSTCGTEVSSKRSHGEPIPEGKRVNRISITVCHCLPNFHGSSWASFWLGVAGHGDAGYSGRIKDAHRSFCTSSGPGLGPGLCALAGI